jgi:hypothetical protein
MAERHVEFCGSWTVCAADAQLLEQTCLAAMEAARKAPGVAYVAELRAKVPEIVQMEAAVGKVLRLEYADVRTTKAMLDAVQQVLTMLYDRAGSPPSRDIE